MISLRTKLGLGFGGLLVIVLVISGLSVIVLTRYSHSIEKVFRENYDSVIHCKRMTEALDALNEDAEHRLWSDPSPSPTQWQSQFDQALKLQILNSNLPGEREMTLGIEPQWADLTTQYHTFLTSRNRRDIYVTQLRPLISKIRQPLEQITEMNLHNMTALDGEVSRTLGRVRSALIVLAIAGTGLAVLLIVSVGPWVLRPITSLTRSTREIEKGNLDVAIEQHGHDEVGQLAEAFSSMAARLREYRKLDHDRLLRTQQTTQLAIDSLPDPVAIFGTDAHVEISNQAAITLFGLNRGESLPSLPLRWLDVAYETAMRGQDYAPQGYRLSVQLFDNGRERFFLPLAVPMRDPGGHVIGVATILLDVTRFKEADEAKSNLVSTVSHELKTPLTSIRMATHMLVEEETSNFTSRQRELLETAMNNGERLFSIIDNLLSISRIESTGGRMNFEPMSPVDLIAHSLSPMRPQFDAKNVRVIVDAPPTLPKVQADPSSVGHILTNLLSNAMKFTPAGGEVKIVATPRSSGEIQFDVTDSGPGVRSEDLPRLFERFFRTTDPSGVRGAGLGLAIAREVAEAHGGSIEAVASDNGGTIFRIILPKFA